MLDRRAIVALSFLAGRARRDAASWLRRRAIELGTDPPPFELVVATFAVPPQQPGLASHLLRRAEVALETADRLGHQTITCVDEGYPALLATIADAPPVLWVYGNVAALDAQTVAIVGARGATAAALELAREMGADLASSGCTVVSGLARGIDAAAHRGALETGRTVAVLGSGLDRVYPAEHTDLASRIAASGAVVSEFPPGIAPRPHHFPLRNRIISGLSHGVVVIEAGERSGALITADFALEQGRDVLAVPGPVAGERNRGAHRLLRDGAALVESAADVLDTLGWHAAGMAPSSGADSADLEGSVGRVLAALIPGEAADLESISVSSGLAAAVVLSALARLELAGRVVRAGGGRFLRCRPKVVT